jgi:hypothetical protein
VSQAGGYDLDLKDQAGQQKPPEEDRRKGTTLADRLEEIELLPQSNPLLHWSVFAISLLSLGMLLAWLINHRGPVNTFWAGLDIGLGVLFAAEFFTREGFRLQRIRYLRSRFFDFVAIAPVLVLVNHGFFGEEVWLWVVLVARSVRVIDRFLGDGFVRRNFLVLVEGFEEEITDRVLERLIARVQADLDRAAFSHTVALALIRNKEAVLKRVHAATPNQGFVPGLAHIVGLDAALEKAENRTYDAVVEVLNSDEVDRAVRDAINASFSRMRFELGDKSWRKQLGIRRGWIR